METLNPNYIIFDAIIGNIGIRVQKGTRNNAAIGFFHLSAEPDYKRSEIPTVFVTEDGRLRRRGEDGRLIDLGGNGNSQEIIGTLKDFSAPLSEMGIRLSFPPEEKNPKN